MEKPAQIDNLEIGYYMSNVIEGQGQNDKRAFKRVRLSEPVRFEFKNPTHYGGCLSADISEGGVRLRVNEFIALGEEISVNIQLSPKKMVEGVGKVVWVQKMPYADQYQVGLEFENLDSIFEARSRIHQYIENQA